MLQPSVAGTKGAKLGEHYLGTVIKVKYFDSRKVIWGLDCVYPELIRLPNFIMCSSRHSKQHPMQTSLAKKKKK